MINIQYFGVLKSNLQRSEEQLAWESGTTQDLLAQLQARGAIWQAALAEDQIFRIVLNHEICYDVKPILKGDCVAFLPPVTGG